MGAGYSGLMMAIVFSQKLQNSNAEFVIYERNKDLGGTWLENRYVERFQKFHPFSKTRSTSTAEAD
jgi:cation diffusion facilitator CzcD-associated flavoprotein CzcO